ncbi:MAG: hypothetical protein P8H98_02515 [Flavobacteriales bacterium]|nr:hypothetical protein [Flavobacteriales bacterium]
MKSAYYLAIAVCLFLFSCTPPQYRTYASKTTNIYGYGVHQLPLVAELEISETRVNTSITRKNMTLSKMKIEAVEILMDSLSLDMIVEPRFSSTQNGYYTTLKASGYPAKYVNFHTLDTSEVALLEAGILHVIPTKEARNEESTIKSKTGLGVFIGILGATVFAALLLI